MIGLVLLAALVRAWHLDHMSIWQDEGLSLYRATRDVGGILSGVIQLGALPTQDLQPPAFFLLLFAWFKLLGVSTWAAKWLTLLAALPTVPLVWALGRRWVGAWTGRLAALLAALSPAYLWYSQEIRGYTLAVTLGLAGVYALARTLAADTPRAARLRWGAVTLVANGLLLWTHYLGFFLVGFELLWLLVVAVRQRRRELVAVVVLLALVGLPLVPFALYRLGLGKERHQVFQPLQDVLFTLLGGFAMGRTMDARLVPLGLLLFLILLAAGVWLLWRRRRASLWLLGGYLLVPTLAFFAVTFIKPTFRGVQHLLIQSPPFYILAAAGVVALARYRGRRAWLGWGLGLAAVAAMLVADWGFYHQPAFAKDDLRGLARYVSERAIPGDILAVSDPVLELAFQQLAPDLDVRALPPMGAGGLPEDRPPQELLAPLLAGRTRLWFMTPDDALKEWLDKRALLVEQRSFHGLDIPVRVDAYERRPAGPGDLPPRGPRDAVLGGLKPLGFEVLPDPARPGHGARVRLAWQVYQEGVPDYKVSLRLLDADGRGFGQADDTVPASQWPYGEVTYWPQDLAVSAGAAPGVYRLGLTVYDPATGQAWPEDGPHVLGPVKVGRAQEPLVPAAVAVDRRLSARGGGVAIFGADLPKTEGIAGEGLPVFVWLSATRDDPSVARLRAELTDGWGRVRATAEAPLSPPDAAPTAGELRRVPLALDLPAGGGRYGLRVRALDAAGEAVWLRRGAVPVRAAALGTVAVTAPERSTAVPAMGHRLDVPVGDTVRLLGYDLAVTEVEPGAELPVTLYWRAEGDTPISYQVTVQLVPLAPDGLPAGPPVAQHDGLPADGSRPTSGWQPGEVITDPHRVPVSRDVVPGDYLLLTALYDPAQPDVPRPEVRQGAVTRDYVALQPVRVGGGGRR